ncbi:MAG: hypothetical protein ACREM2_03120 [Vulcanimicrobiaceae bacterium]
MRHRATIGLAASFGAAMLLAKLAPAGAVPAPTIPGPFVGAPTTQGPMGAQFLLGITPAGIRIVEPPFVKRQPSFSRAEAQRRQAGPMVTAEQRHAAVAKLDAHVRKQLRQIARRRR